MRIYRVLVVDDEKEYRDLAQDAAEGRIDVEVVTAANREDALGRIKESFFNLALVDIELALDDHSNVDGLAVLRYLTQHRPSCERVLLTGHLTHHLSLLGDLVNPISRLLDGIVFKDDFETDFRALVRHKADAWLKGEIEVNGAEVLATRIKERLLEDPSVIPTEDEVNFLISRICGQGTSFARRSIDDVHKITLEEMEGGQSPAVVARARAETGTHHEGIWCVVKIASREDVHEEYLRYCRHLRFHVAVNRRVELLGYESGDALGAICYSFGGKSPKEVQSLQHLFQKSPELAMKCIGDLFDPQKKEWLAEEGPKKDLASHFAAIYQLKNDRASKRIEKFVGDVARKFKWVVNGGFLEVPGEKILLPQKVLGSAVFRIKRSTCITHGDLHGENVIVGENGNAILIDYRSTGNGPRCIDFAALEASLRIATVQHDEPLTSLFVDHKREKEIWSELWSDKIPTAKALEHRKIWQHVSVRLCKLAQGNFADLTWEEYSATCLLWALRIFPVRSFDNHDRLRLLVWMSQLAQELEGKG
jgi:CheY-like chemotaxis protein